MMSDVLNIDYYNSFVQWSSPTDDHTPRVALHAGCRIREKDEEFRQYYLGYPCAGEQMYVEKNIFHQPTLDVHFVYSEDGQLMFVKHFAEAPGYSRLANRLGETVPTHDGKGSTITEMNTGIRKFTQVVEMTEYQEVYNAMTGNLPILGRTSYTTLRGEEEIDVVLEYPITVMNARHKHDTWQIDTGLILVPDFSIECKLEVEIFRRAYIVYNKWDYAEHVMELPDKVEKAVFPIVQLTDPKPLARVVHNQLFVVKTI